MMKKSVILLCLILLVMPLISARCVLDVSLINQDPYPAIPGDYVKLVFQIDGLEERECGDVSFELNEKFPISFDPGTSNIFSAEAGIFERTYGSFLLVPFKVRVDEDALDGENPIEAFVSTKRADDILYEFNLTIEDARADFEVFIKDYDTTTNIMTLEILNTGENDVYALTIDIPKQDNIQVKGSPINIVGDLDSNDYTTADFEAVMQDGEITLDLLYIDEINVRRTVTKNIPFESSYFIGRKQDENGRGTGFYVVILVIVVLVGWWLLKKYKKRKKRKDRRI